MANKSRNRNFEAKKNALITVQVALLIVFAGAVGGMLATTDVYDQIYDRIVSVICLSCIKLNRVFALNYQFNPANGEKYHPEFIIEDLEKAPVFLAFRTDVCEYCDVMEPLIMQVFNNSFEMESVFSETIDFNGSDVIFYHINNDHATGELKNLQDYYDVDGFGAVPMFTIITLEYDHSGIVSPLYLTLYGVLDIDYTSEQRIQEITNLVNDAIELYDENRQGFYPQDFKK